MSTTTQRLGLFKYDTVADSQVPFNIDDALNYNWDIIDQKVGPNRNVGEIIASSLPLTDAGLHLLDGSLINGDGIYKNFVDYITGLYEDYSNLFCTESDWQTSITNYGVCGKFVYIPEETYYAWEIDNTNSSNLSNGDTIYTLSEHPNGENYYLHPSPNVWIETNVQIYELDGYRIDTSNGDAGFRNTSMDVEQTEKVRLPKITGILEGTTDVTALGDLVEAGLPFSWLEHKHTRGDMNIQARFTFKTSQGAILGVHSFSGAGWTEGSGKISSPDGGADSDKTGNRAVFLNAASAWTGSTSTPNYTSTTRDKTTVQPQTIKVFYYIVIATQAKTSIEVDIDEIATDLNGKADTDLTNCTNVANIKMVHNVMPSNTALAFTPAYSTSYTMPADGYLTVSGTATANYGYVGIRNVTRGYQTINWGIVINNIGTCWLPVRKGDICYGFGWQTNCQGISFTYAVGSESEAS